MSHVGGWVENTVRTDTYSCILCRVKFETYANGNATQMARLVSRGSAGCIAAMDQMNPRSYIIGAEPWQGVQLKIQWFRLLGKYTTQPLNSTITRLLL